MGTPAGERRATALVLAYGEEPLLGECVRALLGSVDVVVDVVVVDNGCTSPAVDEVRDLAGVHVLTAPANLGFTGGCNLGARHATGEVLVLVNSDAVVQPTAVAALVSALSDDRVGIAGASVRLLDRPDLVNSVGNPVHYLGLSWAGGLGQPAADHAVPGSVASASGAAMALRRGTWDRLGGFFEPMFAYGEDMELSLRCRQHGWDVRYVPDAVALHAYEFHRNPLKMYLLERNRLLVVLTLYEARTLAVLAPALVALELAVLAVAVRQGWWRQKVRGWVWLLGHTRLLRRRRAEVQRSRLVPDAVLAEQLTARFEPGAETGFAAPAPLSAASAAYWRLARAVIGRTGG